MAVCIYQNLQNLIAQRMEGYIQEESGDLVLPESKVALKNIEK